MQLRLFNSMCTGRLLHCYMLDEFICHLIIQECFLGDPLQKLLKNCSKNSARLNKMAARAINRNMLLTTSAKLVDRF